jgi:hypothetical protein
MNSFCARFPCGRTQHNSQPARSKSGLTGSLEVKLHSWIIYGSYFNSTRYSTSIKMWSWPLKVMQDLFFGYLTTFYQLKKHRIRRKDDPRIRPRKVGKMRIWCISNTYRGLCLKELRKSTENLRNAAGIPARIKSGSFRIRRWWVHHSKAMSLVLQSTSDILEKMTNPWDSGQNKKEDYCLGADRGQRSPFRSLSTSLLNKVFVTHILNYTSARSAQYSGK